MAIPPTHGRPPNERRPKDGEDDTRVAREAARSADRRQAARDAAGALRRRR